MSASTPVAVDHEWLTGTAGALAAIPRPRQPEPEPEPPEPFSCFWCGLSHGDGLGFQCALCAPLHPDHSAKLVNVAARDILNLRLTYAAATYRAVLEWIGQALDHDQIDEARAVVYACRTIPLRELAPVLRVLALADRRLRP